MLTLITGGIRSGKSAQALERARSFPGPKYFLATAEPLDEEMKLRITRHQAERGLEFLTIEEPVHLSSALKKIPQEQGLILIDCLTLWINNLLFHFENEPARVQNEIESFLEEIRQKNQT